MRESIAKKIRRQAEEETTGTTNREYRVRKIYQDLKARYKRKRTVKNIPEPVNAVRITPSINSRIKRRERNKSAQFLSMNDFPLHFTKKMAINKLKSEGITARYSGNEKKFYYNRNADQITI